MKARSLEQGLAVVLFGGIVLLAVFGMFASEPGELPAKSASSKAADGRRAAFALLAELGYEVEEWRQPPGDLPRGGGLLFVPSIPITLGMEPDDEAQEAVGARPLLGPSHDPLGYVQFIEAGGTLVLPVSDLTQTFITEHLGFDGLAGLCAPTEAEPERLRIQLPDGSTVRADWPLASAFPGFLYGGPCTPLLQDELGLPLALEVRLGAGHLVLLGSDDFLSNAALDTADHALLLVRIVEEFAQGGPVLFDEYALGRWRPTGATEMALKPRFAAITWHLALLLLLFVWRHAWVREFPRDPESLAAVSPLARARSTASLLERAGRIDLAASRLIDGVLASLARSLRVPLRTLTVSDDRARRLATIAARAGLDHRTGAWRAAILERDVRGAQDLEQLGVALADLERECRAAGRRS